MTTQYRRNHQPLHGLALTKLQRPFSQVYNLQYRRVLNKSYGDILPDCGF